MTEETKTLYALHCYALGCAYLLPSVAVQAVIPYTPLEGPSEPGLLGTLVWQAQKVSVIDVKLRAEQVAITPLSHLMIFKVMVDQRVQFVATLVEQIPRPITIKPHDLVFTESAYDGFYPFHGRHIEGEIIDLSVLGERLSKAHFDIFKSPPKQSED